ncbi:MAG TPA: hypothetical protein VFA65_21415 [Bryobacteraceae bacterium]|nr:hypothetical protein [Bryobacteraceae bacterium]
MTSKETEGAYAFWNSPGESFTVTYSLEQFHEIDFEVNEGYRRIPHGGIEVGGLLFGRSEDNGIRVQAFRPIACEHATGPSFNLSDHDLEQLQKQIAGSASDPELAGLEVVGWFIAHTRTPLRLNDREAELFDRFFPKANQITILIKPERFQPTKFGFFVRKADGSLERDAATSPVILPLPGRAARGAEGPVASIPAPAEKAASSKADTAEVASSAEAAPAKAAPEPEPAALESEPASSSVGLAAKSPVPNVPVASPERQDRHGVTRPRVNGARTSFPASPATLPEPAAAESTALSTIPKENKLPSINEIQRRRSGSSQAGTPSRQIADEGAAYNARLVLILFFAAILGCAVGFWAYRELPAPVVPLSVRPEASGLTVMWPAEQTRQTAYAAIRVNDGAQQPLSPDEREAGAAHITPPTLSNVKVELIVQHWMRDSRGIVRYVNAIPPTATTPDQQLSH